MTRYDEGCEIEDRSFKRLWATLRARAGILFYVAHIVSSSTQRRYALEWVRSTRRGYLLDKPSPWITFDAIDLIRDKVKGGSKVLEYGSGGSTLFWLSLGATCVSIEHDPEWYSLIKAYLGPGDQIDYRLILPEKDESTCERDPADPDMYVSNAERYKNCRFFEYASQADSFPDGYFDAVFVDGRARPSCIKHGYRKVKPGGILILDDTQRTYYFSNTGEYLAGFERTECHGVSPVMNFSRCTEIYTRKRGFGTGE